MKLIDHDCTTTMRFTYTFEDLRQCWLSHQVGGQFCDRLRVPGRCERRADKCQTDGSAEVMIYSNAIGLFAGTTKC
jgi:hypothetical protein